MKKQCPECEDPIIGRTDKKFCSDGCRNSYNNRVNKDQKNFRYEFSDMIDQILAVQLKF